MTSERARTRVTIRGMLAAAGVFAGVWLAVAIVQARWKCSWADMDVDNDGWVSLPDLLRAADHGCEGDTRRPNLRLQWPGASVATLPLAPATETQNR
jgi:hypothetical protein